MSLHSLDPNKVEAAWFNAVLASEGMPQELALLADDSNIDNIDPTFIKPRTADEKVAWALGLDQQTDVCVFMECNHVH